MIAPRIKYVLGLLCLCHNSVVNGQTDGGTDNTGDAETVSPTTISPTTQTTTDGWGGCVDPETGSSTVTIGEKTTICLVVADGVDWQAERTYMRLHFQPIADQYSRFVVPQCKFPF